jgi:cytochrome d ubiquinol oxidase subunit I
MLDATIFDRFAMGFSLGVHILLVMFGMTLPVIILLADFMWLRKKDMIYRTLSERLTAVFAISLEWALRQECLWP